MNVRRADDFITDAELQFEWYAEHAGWEVADSYLAAVASTCALIGRQPLLGPIAALKHTRLAKWRFFVVIRPFHRHVIFYELSDDSVIVRRILHGHRYRQKRLLEPPGRSD